MSEQPEKTARPILAALIADVVIGGFFGCLGVTLLRFSMGLDQWPLMLRLCGSGFALLLLAVGGIRILAGLSGTFRRPAAVDPANTPGPGE